MIHRIPCAGARQPVYLYRGNGLKDILISASAKAARALKGPALQLIKQAGQKVGEKALQKAKQIVTKSNSLGNLVQINRILNTKRKTKSNSRGKMPQINRILSKNVSNLIG